MMLRRLTIAMMIVFAAFAGAAASSKKAGTSGAQFLKIGGGARPTAMGDAFVAVSEDLNSAYFNPAGIANISRPQFLAMHTQWLADSSYDYGSFYYPTKSGGIAASVATLKVDDLQRRSADETRTGSFEASDSAYALTYGRNLTPLLAAGITGRYIKQSIDSYSANTWSMDVGLNKRFVSRQLALGLAVRHIGKAVEFKNESDPLPTTVDAGFSMPLLDERLLWTGDARWLRDNNPKFGMGLEYRNQLSAKGRFALRGGYNSAVTDGGAAGLTMGAGIGLGRLDLDFAWVPFADLGNTYRFAAHVKF